MNRIEELCEKIKKCSEAYYLGTEILVSDKEFDDMIDELRSLDSNNPILKQVGWGITPYGTTRKLRNPITVSLPKVKSIGEPDPDFLYDISLKVDGMTVQLEYEDGQLKYAITRGNGIEGIDITEKFRTGKIKGSEYYMNLKEFYAESDPNPIFRGELYISYEDFNKYLSNDYSNPRNAVSGIVNRKSLDNLEYLTFKIHPNCNNYYNDDAGIPHRLFKPEEFKFETLKGFYDLYKNIIPCDGIVIAPFNANNPMSFDTSYALKFKTEIVETKIEEIEWNLSGKGCLVPVIKFNEIELYGAKVSRATGISYQNVIDTALVPGSRIKVTRANEVIPQILENMETLNKEIVKKIVDESIENRDQYVQVGVNLFLENESKLNELILSSFVSYHFEVDGFRKASELFIDKFEIKDLDNIDHFNNVDDLNSLKHINDDMYNYVLSCSNKSTVKRVIDKLFYEPMSLNGFFSQFGLRGFGWSNAMNLEEYIFKMYKETPFISYSIFFSHLLNNDIDIDEIPVNVTCKTWLNNHRVMSKLYKTLNYFTKRWKYYEEDKDEVKFKVVITGSLDKPRNQVVEDLKLLRVEVTENIKEKDVKYLVCNKPSNSSKFKYAKENNIEIISYENLLSIIKGL